MAFFDIDRAAGAARGDQKIGLAAQERGDLEDVGSLGGGFGLRGFVEVGYVFNRELFYVSQVPPPFELDDTFLIRGGVAF